MLVFFDIIRLEEVLRKGSDEMNCPVCEDVRMKEVERYGVLIDICPNCKGIWLDRGELEKITEQVKEVRQPFNQWYERDDDWEHEDRHHGHDDHEHHRYHDDDGHSHYPRKKKKESVFDMFGDMFD